MDRLGFLALSWSLVSAPLARAYESYHNPNTQGAGYCSTCHSGFLDQGPLHDQHTAMATCSLCHTGSGRDNPIIMWSQNNQLGCMGCHGLDYGETIQANYRTFATQGLHKNSGYGLRKHHARSGVTQCAGCHDTDENVPPFAENVINTGLGFTTNYYARADVLLGGNQLNPCSNEDTPDDTDTRGLDNDGDGLYDGQDPDCAGTPVQLTLLTTSTNTVVLSWPHGFDGWRVQATSTLGGTWSDLPSVPREATLAGPWQVILTPEPTSRFYRLNRRQF